MLIGNKTKSNHKSIKSKYVKQSKAKAIWKQFKKNKGAMVGIAILSVVIIMAVISGFIWNYDTDIAGMNASERLQAPSWQHPFGN